MFLSLKVLAVDIPLLLVMGTSLGWVLARLNFRGKEVLNMLVFLPVVLPPSVLGLYLLMLLGHIPLMRSLGLLFSFPAAVVAALFPSLPIMVQAARSGFASVDVGLEEAARTLGDGELAVFWRVSFPIARRFLMAGLALASARALGDFGVTLMIAGNIPGRTQTLPLYIYSRVEALDLVGANIAALFLTGVGVASLLLIKHMEGGYGGVS